MRKTEFDNCSIKQLLERLERKERAQITEHLTTHLLINSYIFKLTTFWALKPSLKRLFLRIVIKLF